jgi:hypothetical protein
LSSEERIKRTAVKCVWALKWPSLISFSNVIYTQTDRFCSLVVRVPGYRSRGPGSIPGATRFSEKYWVWNGVHSASWVQLRSYLKEKVEAPV